MVKEAEFTKKRMKVHFSIKILCISVGVVLADIGLSQDGTQGFGLEHERYRNEEIKVDQFDRDEYDKIRKLMILKSKGIAVADMDRIDEDFNPERYVENNPDGNSDFWSKEYDLDDAEYAENWGEYYERDYDNYEELQREDHYELRRSEEREVQRNAELNSPMSGVWGVVLILVLIVILVIVLVFLFLSKDDDTAIEKDGIDDLAPSEIPQSELEWMLKSALASKDFRKAIRIYFIFMIKDLSEKGWISWEKKKTNMLYLREMKGRPLYKEFRDVVSIYEVVWYGKRNVSEADYRSIEPKLKLALDSISKFKE